MVSILLSSGDRAAVTFCWAGTGTKPCLHTTHHPVSERQGPCFKGVPGKCEVSGPRRGHATLYLRLSRGTSGQQAVIGWGIGESRRSEGTALSLPGKREKELAARCWVSKSDLADSPHFTTGQAGCPSFSLALFMRLAASTHCTCFCDSRHLFISATLRGPGFVELMPHLGLRGWSCLSLCPFKKCNFALSRFRKNLLAADKLPRRDWGHCPALGLAGSLGHWLFLKGHPEKTLSPHTGSHKPVRTSPQSVTRSSPCFHPGSLSSVMMSSLLSLLPSQYYGYYYYCYYYHYYYYCHHHYYDYHTITVTINAIIIRAMIINTILLLLLLLLLLSVLWLLVSLFLSLLLLFILLLSLSLLSLYYYYYYSYDYYYYCMPNFFTRL